MIFHSFQYLVFLPIIVALHFALPHRWRWALLLGASYWFYAAWRVDFLWLLILSTVTDYVVGLRLEAARSKRARQAILTVSLAVNLGLLCAFKYTAAIWDMIGQVATGLFAADPSAFQHIDIILPLGISFYTFQTISYTIDVYRRRIPAERHLGYFALYVAFFPQLLAGPIERASQLLSQLRTPQRFDPHWIGPAFLLIVLGLAKKLVIADRLAIILVQVVNDPLRFRPIDVLLPPPAIVYQYYCDLSGYADIALGSAMLLGIRLSRNFDRPFASSSTMRFWYRWHVTVTAWFRDYLMRSLVQGGSVAASRPLVLMVTGLLIGLWHGPTLGWAVAGCSVGLLAIPESKWARWRIRNSVGPRGPWQRVAWDWAGRFYVWFVVFFLIGLPLTWGDLGTLQGVLGHVLSWDGDGTARASLFALYGGRILLVMAAISALEIWQWMEARQWSGRLIAAMGVELRWLAAAAFSACVMILAELSQNGFLYFKF